MEQPRPSSRNVAFVGSLLVFVGLTLNRFALGKTLAPDGDIENVVSQRIILGFEATLIVAGLLVIVLRPRLPRWLARLTVVPLLLAAGFGAYGTVLAFLPSSAAQQRMGRMERSERLYIAVVPRLQALNNAALDLELPGQAASLFGETLAVPSDLGGGGAETATTLADATLRNWPLDHQPRSAPTRDAALWKPFFTDTRYLSRASFAIVLARFPGPDERRWQTDIHFSALARLASGKLVQVDAEIEALWAASAAMTDPLAEGAWHIVEWRTRSFALAETSQPFFVEATEASLPNAGDLDRARTSLHDRYVVEHFRNKTKPHEYFTYQDFDRHPGLAVVDIDKDGLDDLYVMSEFGKNMLLHNEGDGTFRDIAPQIGLDIDGFSSSAVFADFDNDGHPDLILGRTLKRSMYLVNEGGHFVDRSEKLVGSPLPYLVSSVSVADYNGDGLLDVYFATYAAEMFFSHAGAPELFLPPEQAAEFRRRAKSESHWLQARVGPPNLLLQNMGKGRFEISPASKEVEVWRNSYEGTWADYDHDGHPDLYVVNDFGENNLFRNDGHGHFKDVTAETGTADPGFGMGASFGDYDNDGQPDLYISKMYSKAGRRIIGNLGDEAREFGPLARGNTLLHHVGARFERVSGTQPPSMMVQQAGWSWGSQFADLNNDGFLDIFALAGYYTAPKEIAIPVDT